MALRVRCPHCDAAYTFTDQSRGKKVRCKKCEKIFTAEEADEAVAIVEKPSKGKSAPAAARKERAGRDADERSEAIRTSARKKARTPEEDEDDDREGEEDKSGSSKGMLFALIGGAGLLVLIGGGVLVWALTRSLAGPAQPAGGPAQRAARPAQPPAGPVAQVPAPAPLVDEKRLAEMLKPLTDPDPAKRAEGCRQLGIIVDAAKKAVPHLMEALKDPEPSVRKMAIYALGRARATNAVPQIAQMVNGPNEDVGQEALNTLLSFEKDAAEAIPAILQATNSKKNGWLAKTALTSIDPVRFPKGAPIDPVLLAQIPMNPMPVNPMPVAGSFNKENAEKLRAGMTEQEVIALLGMPQSRSSVPNSGKGPDGQPLPPTVFLNFADNALRVVFENDKVQSVFGLGIALASKGPDPKPIDPKPIDPKPADPAGQAGILFRENVEKLRKGMSEEEVVALLGKPGRKTTPTPGRDPKGKPYPPTTMLFFSNGPHQLQVNLLDGKAIALLGNMNITLPDNVVVSRPDNVPVPKPDDDFKVTISNVRIAPVAGKGGKVCHVSLDLKATGKSPGVFGPSYQCGATFKVKGVKQEFVTGLGLPQTADALLKGVHISNGQIIVPNDADDTCDIVVTATSRGKQTTVAQFTDVPLGGGGSGGQGGLIVLKNVRVDKLNDATVVLQLEYEFTRKPDPKRWYLIDIQRDNLPPTTEVKYLWSARGDNVAMKGQLRFEVGNATAKYGTGKEYRVWAESTPGVVIFADKVRTESTAFVAPINGAGVEEVTPGSDEFKITLAHGQVERIVEKDKPGQCRISLDIGARGKPTTRGYQCGVAFRVNGVKQQPVNFGERYDAAALLKGAKIDRVMVPLPDGSADDCEVVVRDAEDNSVVSHVALSMGSSSGSGAGQFAEKKLEASFTIPVVEEVRALALSPKEDLLACVGGVELGKRRILLSDPQTGKPKGRLLGTGIPAGLVSFMSFTPDGRGLVAQKGADFELWSFASDKLTNPYGSFFNPFIRGESVLAASPKGGFFLHTRGQERVVFDDKTLKPLATLQEMPSKPPLLFTVSPDTKLIASWGCENLLEEVMYVYSWQRESGKRFPPYRFPVKGLKDLKLALSHDGELIAVTQQGDRNFYVADVKTGKGLWRDKGHAQAVKTVAFSPDGKLLVSAGEDGQICVWDGRDGSPLAKFLMPPQIYPMTLLFSSDSQRLYAGCSIHEGTGFGGKGAVLMWETAKVLDGVKLEDKPRRQPKGAEPTGN